MDANVSIVIDGKDKEHKLEGKWNDSVCHWFNYLDGKRIEPDDRYGWVYVSPDKETPIRDKVLQDNIDRIVFGHIIPAGMDSEGSD